MERYLVGTVWRWDETAAAGATATPLARARTELALRPATLPKAPPASIALVSDRAAFDALEPEWNDLFRRAGKGPQVFQTFNWNWHWANHYLPADGSERTLAVVTVRRHGRLVMLWPLVLERVAGLKVLQWMGEPVSQYGDVLAEDGPDTPALLQQAWEFIIKRLGADAIHLRKVRADAVVAPLLAAAGLRPTALAEAPCLDLASAPDFAAYETRYSGKARKNRRRLLRRLTERGPFQFLHHAGGPEARAAALEAIALKAKWIKDTGRVSMALADARFAAFFADAADGCGRDAGCHVRILTSSGETVGIAIDVTCGDHRAAHIIVHDPALDSYSPGTLLLQEWIRRASADRMATFDLLAPAYAYKLDWADRSVAVVDHALGLSLAGRAYVGVYLGFLRERLKAGAEALPHLIERLRKLAGRARAGGRPARAATIAADAEERAAP